MTRNTPSFRLALALGLFLAVPAISAFAQTTVTLPAVTWGTVRAGASANAFQGDLLATRASDTPDYLRRALLKFDTDTTIPAGTPISSATLTVTISYANSGTARHIAAYPVTDSYGDQDFSWNYRRISQAQTWSSAGGDLGTRLAVEPVGSTVGTTVTYDVTSLVQEVVSGKDGSSRYTRLALIDEDGSSRDSYREFATPTAGNAAARPTLSVTYGGSGSTGGSGSGSGVPKFSRVFTIVMENEEATSIIGNSAAPFINKLASDNGLATNYTGVAHPSLPNYMALTGGKTVFTSDCQGCTTTASNIVDEFVTAGLHWKTYMEAMPKACDATDSGTYAQKHNPFVHYTDILNNAHRCTTKNVPFSDFDYDLQTNTLPDYVWITPDLCHDMHDCSIQVGDTWLSQIVPEITSSPAFKDAVLFITWDEGTTSSGGGGQVPLIVVSSHTPAGTKVSTPYNHYNLLATIEDAWGLQRLGKSAGIAVMKEFFK